MALKWDISEYTPRSLQAYSPAEVRREYTRQRDIAMKRLKRMEQDWDNLAMPDVVDRLVEEEQVTHYEAVSRLLRQAKEEYTVMVNKG